VASRGRRLASIFLLGLAAGFAAVPLRAQDEASAQAFLNSVFRLYPKNGKGVPYNHRYLHSALLELIDTDAKLSGNDIPIAGDGDIVCGCQDWEGFFIKKMDLHVDKPGHAEALVTFSLFKDPNPQTSEVRKFRYILAAEGGQWRIFNVEYLTDPGSESKPWSVRDQIEQEIASLRHAKK
jgi:hypothetical protein